jgi:hypothetical protein
MNMVTPLAFSRGDKLKCMKGEEGMMLSKALGSISDETHMGMREEHRSRGDNRLWHDSISMLVIMF